MSKRSKESEVILTPEEEAAAERIYQSIKEKMDQQVKRMVRTMAAKKPHELFGRGEFELRDMALELGANVLEAAANEQSKKGVPES